MEYLVINSTDFSRYVNELKVKRQANYNAQTNAAGDTVVDYINTKHTLEVGFIPMNDVEMEELQRELERFNVDITFRSPLSNGEVNIICIVPENEIEYYTIRVDKVMYKACTITFVEL